MAGGRILVVEDDPDILTTLSEALKLIFELDIDTATNGLDAQKRLEQDSYVLIFADEQMPFMRGSELLSWAMEHRPDVRRVLMSSLVSSQDLARKPAVEAFLQKPLTLESLAACLSVHLHKGPLISSSHVRAPSGLGG